MSRDRGPVLKRARALGIEPQYLGVNKKSKRHGAVRRRKKSEYGIQLTEKQKVRFTYGLSSTRHRREKAEPVRTSSSCSKADSTMLYSEWDSQLQEEKPDSL